MPLNRTPAYTGGYPPDDEETSRPLLNMPSEIFRVYTIPVSEDEDNKPKDALRTCPGFMKEFILGDRESITDEALRPIDSLMQDFYEFGYLPREPYPYDPTIQYVTAMDAPLLILLRWTIPAMRPTR